jgi:hypothetical protein
MLKEMSPRAIAEPPYAVRLPERGLLLEVGGLCRPPVKRSRGRRGEAWLNCLEDCWIMPYRMGVIRYMSLSCVDRLMEK